MSANVDKVIQIVSEVLNRDDITLQSNRESLPEWDSMAYMEIAGRAEQELGIEISATNIEKFDSVESIAGMMVE